MATLCEDHYTFLIIYCQRIKGSVLLRGFVKCNVTPSVL